ncbi:MAG: hypothetical protein JRC92_08845, partial [Deltaproteobacteria bacterium]|nr:hypothetical protein [Deltaproteobacteria bacterium]
SLDTVTEATFQRLNRPHPDINLEEILKGLHALRSTAKGEIWLEILFVAGINDTPPEIEGLKREVDRIAPDRVQINSVDRPPAEDEASPVDFNRLTELANLFGPRTEVIFNPPQDFRPGRQKELAEAVLDLISRRPCTTADLKVALGRSDAEMGSLLKMLTLKGQIQEEVLGDRVFLRALASKE